MKSIDGTEATFTSTTLTSEKISVAADWMRLKCLPFWASTGVDAETGLFCERMTLTGRPDRDAPLRMRVQFRQIYTLSYAAFLGWYPDGARVAHTAWLALEALLADDTGEGYPHLLSRTGSVVDNRRDSYDHAFAILAVAWLWRVTGERKLAQTLARIIAFADNHLTSPSGLLREGLPDSSPYRQNPQLHWYEAMICLIETGMLPEAQTRANSLRRLFEAFLLDRDHGVVGEFYDQHCRPVQGDQGTVVAPGHIAEWSWLMRKHEMLTGAARSALPSHLLARARTFAAMNGGILPDEATKAGTITSSTSRIWPQTEYLKAEIAETEAGFSNSAAAVERTLELLGRLYLFKPFEQGWVDQIDRSGRSVSQFVPASILYHVFVAIVELTGFSAFANPMRD